MLNSTFVVPQVLTHILPAEEFWAEHSPAMTATAKAKLGQEVGVSGSFLSDIKPQAGTKTTNNFRRELYSGNPETKLFVFIIPITAHNYVDPAYLF